MALLLHLVAIFIYKCGGYNAIRSYVLLKEIEVQEMQFKSSLLVALCASLLLPGCVAVSNNQSNIPSNARIQGVSSVQSDKSVYQQKGMEISAVTSRMATTMQEHMLHYLLPYAPVDRTSEKGDVKIVTMPRIAVTSFVDTDTFENAGYLGRALAEFFTHEMSSRGFEVTEYKLTGSLSVTKDGDFILSRNWKKIAKDTNVKYLLGGTITRNNSGVVLVSRVINMQTRQVISSATDFIPYNLLPSCYRTVTKQCDFAGAGGYLSKEQIREANYYKTKYVEAQGKLDVLTANSAAVKAERARAQKAITKAQIVSSNGKPLGGVYLSSDGAPSVAMTTTSSANGSKATTSSGTTGFTATPEERKNYNFFDSSDKGPKTKPDPRLKDNVVVGATSRGNYDVYLEDTSSDNVMPACILGKCKDPVVYPANTYLHNTMLVRDTADESGYRRVSK